MKLSLLILTLLISNVTLSQLIRINFHGYDENNNENRNLNLQIGKTFVDGDRFVPYIKITASTKKVDTTIYISEADYSKIWKMAQRIESKRIISNKIDGLKHITEIFIKEFCSTVKYEICDLKINGLNDTLSQFMRSVFSHSSIELKEYYK